MQCPHDFSELISCQSKGEPDYLTCPTCGRRYPIIRGIPVLFDPSLSSAGDAKQVEFYEEVYGREIEGKAETYDKARNCSETLINNTWRRIRDFYAKSKSVNEVFHCFEEQFSFRGGERVLEIGCGLGTPGTEVCIENRDRIHYVGLDFALKPLLSLRRRFAENGADHFRLVHANILDEGLVHESFDIVFGRGILHHFDKTKKPVLAKRIYSLLKPGGKAFFLEPLNTNPVMVSLRALSRPFRPNLSWEHPFSSKEMKSFVTVFDSHEVHYFIAFSLLSMATAFHRTLFEVTDQAFNKIDHALSSRSWWRNFYTKCVITLFRH